MDIQPVNMLSERLMHRVETTNLGSAKIIMHNHGQLLAYLVLHNRPVAHRTS